jgi:PqqD family protein of HPr-rel-A system
MERLDERPRIRDDLTVVELDGEAVIYDEVNGDFHRLNPTATLVFSLLDGSVTLEELARDLAKAYAMKDEDVIAQVRELASQLAASHLLAGTEPGLFAEVDGDDGA